ncbi:MAG: tail protein X [Deltaproteobacteria bacterium]|nr:tail protein X [Deltaproteobacteria bacterium]
MSTKTYTTIEGQAWDQVAYRIWGREDMTHHLLAANPDVAHLVTLPADLKLVVPDLTPPAQVLPPPWKERRP